MDITQSEILDLAADLRGRYAARNAEYDRARRRYRGEHWDAETNPEPPRGTRYALTVNYLKPVVDKSVQLLVGRMPGLQVMPTGADDISRRHAEALEAVLYGTYDANDAAAVFHRVAFDSFLLRRGLIYVWWDPQRRMVRFKDVVPDNFYPVYDGEEIVEALYISRRNTKVLKRQYPRLADLISEDDQGTAAPAIDPLRASERGTTTVIEYFNADGTHARCVGDAFLEPFSLGYGFDAIPFVEFPCFPVGGEQEPLNLIDQIVELNQYLDQIVSQKADIIRKYSNPTIVAENTGQDPEAIRRAVSADGAVLPTKQGARVSFLTWDGSTPGIDEQLAFISDALFDLSGKPRSAYGQTVTNQSGVVTNLALTPTLQSNEEHETLWGHRLSRMNEYILRLWEKFSAAERIQFRGLGATGRGEQTRYYDVDISGADIGGWYKNRIKWPSAIRVDDPVYVQNIISQVTSDPPLLSVYDAAEMLGHEDVEALIDRIARQLEDPRFHPDRLQALTGAMGQLQQAANVDPAAEAALSGLEGGGGTDTAAMNSAMQAGANPNLGKV